jgi:hypothetical protein
VAELEYAAKSVDVALFVLERAISEMRASREGRHHYLRGTHPRGDHRVHRAAAGPGLRMMRLFTKWGWPWELLLWLLG